MKKRLLILYITIFLPLPLLSQITVTATATPSNCSNNGSITITGTGLPGSVVYGIAKTPFNTSNIISSPTATFTMLEPGDYFYGYYTGTTFVKSTNAVVVQNRYSTISPTFYNFGSAYYAYCGSVDPLGRISSRISGGNKPFKIELLNASGDVVQELQNLTLDYFTFSGVAAGDYRLRATDVCGTIVTAPTIITQKANVPYTDFTLGVAAFPYSIPFEVIYNTPNDICSGIASATVKQVFSYMGGDVTDVTTVGSAGNRPQFYGPKTITYKIEIQNESGGFDVYDNLTLIEANSTPFSLPTDRSKWGLIKMSVTICGITKTNQFDLAAYDKFKQKPFSGISFNIYDDPAPLACGAVPTQVQVRTAEFSIESGCKPITLTITENGTTNTQQHTLVQNYKFMLDIGKTYTMQVKDAAGTELPAYKFKNETSSISSKLDQTDPANLFINPAHFMPKLQKDKIVFMDGPSTQFLGKSALMVYNLTTQRGLTAPVQIKAISGPSAINEVATPTASSYYTKLGNQLLPGTYRIKISDAACFDAEYDVVLNSYLVSAVLENVTSEPDPVVCDRYIKKGQIKVTAVGKMASSEIQSVYGQDVISVGLISKPSAATNFKTSHPNGSFLLKGGNKTEAFQFASDVSGDYELALTFSTDYNKFLIPVDVLPGTATVPLSILPNYPTFDMTKSGGVICPGNSTGTLTVKIDNTIGAVTYFIKAQSDLDYPALGQTNPVFTGLVPGNYEIKAKTACYEVIQPFALLLSTAVSDIIVGNDKFCAGTSLHFEAIPLGPITSITWTLPDGSTTNLLQLHIDNVTPAMSGIYKVDIVTTGGCSFTESKTVLVKPKATAANISTANQTKCSGESIRLIASSAEVNPIFNWYSDAALTNLLGTGEGLTVAPTVTTTYYVTVQSNNICENAPGTGQTVTVTVNPWAPADAIDAVGTVICIGQTLTLQATTMISNPVFTWYNGNTIGATNIGTGASLAVNPVVTTTYYVGVYGTNTCETKPADRKAVTVTVNPRATLGDVLVNDLTVCAGELGTFTATSTTVTNPVFTWYRSIGANNFTQLATGPTFTPSASDYGGQAQLVYYVTVRGDNKCENELVIPKMKEVKLLVKRGGTAAEIGGSNPSICTGQSATLSIDSSTLFGNSTYIKIYSDEALTNLLYTTPLTTVLAVQYVTPVLTGTTKYYVTALSNTICENSVGNARVITVTVKPKANASTISVHVIRH